MIIHKPVNQKQTSYGQEKKGLLCYAIDNERLSFFLFLHFRATCVAPGSSQARGRIRAAAAGPHHSHSNAGSEPHLQPIPQLKALLDSLTHWARPGIEPTTLWILVRFIIAELQRELLKDLFLKQLDCPNTEFSYSSTWPSHAFSHSILKELFEAGTIIPIYK